MVWVTVGEDAGGPDLAAKLVSAARLFDPARAGGDRPAGGRRGVGAGAGGSAGAAGGRRCVVDRAGGAVPDRRRTGRGAAVHHPPAGVLPDGVAPGAGGSDDRRRGPRAAHRRAPGAAAGAGRGRRCGRRGGGRCCCRWCTARSATPSRRAGIRPAELADVLAALQVEGITALDATNPGERSAAVAATIEVSLRRLTPDEQARYRELAVFGEDVAIPGDVVARLWAHTGGWTRFQARRLCRRLFDLGLLADYRRDPDRLVLHDVIRAYLRQTTREQRARVGRGRGRRPPRPAAARRRVGRPARRRGVPVVVVGDAPVRGGSARRAGGGAGRPAVAGQQAGAGRAGRSGVGPAAVRATAGAGVGGRGAAERAPARPARPARVAGGDVRLPAARPHRPGRAARADPGHHRPARTCAAWARCRTCRTTPCCAS